MTREQITVRESIRRSLARRPDMADHEDGCEEPECVEACEWGQCRCAGCDRQLDSSVDDLGPVTDRDIETLRDEAGAHGDVAMRIMCDMALYGEDSLRDEECLDEAGCPDDSGGGHDPHELEEIRRALRMSRSEAREECERVILLGRVRS